MTDTAVKATLAETIITQIEDEYTNAAKDLLELSTGIAGTVERANIVAPTRIEALNRANTEYTVWGNARTIASSLLEQDVSPEGVVRVLNRRAIMELTGQGIVQHASGAAADNDLYERAVWARIFHMTETN